MSIQAASSSTTIVRTYAYPRIALFCGNSGSKCSAWQKNTWGYTFALILIPSKVIIVIYSEMEIDVSVFKFDFNKELIILINSNAD